MTVLGDPPTLLARTTLDRAVCRRAVVRLTRAGSLNHRTFEVNAPQHQLYTPTGPGSAEALPAVLFGDFVAVVPVLAVVRRGARVPAAAEGG